MAFDLMQMLDLKRKRPDVPAYTGPKPPSSIYESEEAKKLRKRLEERIAGLNVGYRPEMLSTTAPYARARREGFKRYEKPLISAEASARGIGRSTIPVGRIALSAQEAERDIEERIADLILKSEAQRSADIQNALRQYGELISADIAQKTGAAEFERGTFRGQQALAVPAEEQAIAEDVKMRDRLISTALGAIGGGIKGTTREYSKYGNIELLDTLKKLSALVAKT